MRIIARLQSHLQALAQPRNFAYLPIAAATWRKEHPEAYRATIDKATARMRKTNRRNLWEELRGKGAFRLVERSRRFCIANHRLTLPKTFPASSITVCVSILSPEEVESNSNGVLGGRYRVKIVREDGEYIYFIPGTTGYKRTVRNSTFSRPYREPDEPNLVGWIREMAKEFPEIDRAKLAVKKS